MLSKKGRLIAVTSEGREITTRRGSTATTLGRTPQSTGHDGLLVGEEPKSSTILSGM
jgi:hypothetical protein